MKKIEKIVQSLLEKKLDVISWLVIFFSFVFLRVFTEQTLALARPLTTLEIIMELVHSFYFFALAILSVWLLVSLILRMKPQKLSHIFIFSMLLIIMPPFLDMLKTGGQVYWSFYLLSSPTDLWQQYLTAFGHLPSGIAYFGTRIVFVATIPMLAGLVWFLSKKIWKTVLAAIGAYSILFFWGAFPSFFYYAYIFFSRHGKVSAVHSFDIAGYFGAPEKIFGVIFPSFQYTLAYKLNYVYFILLVSLLVVMFYLGSREKFWAVMKNLRLPQVVYHAGIFFIGMGLGWLGYADNFQLDVFPVMAAFVLLASVILSWVASVVVNDIYDLEIDRVSNDSRPLPKNIFTHGEYIQFGLACFFLALLGGETIGLPFFVFLAVYQVLAWIYSAPPFRLKKFPIVATFISSLASLMILFLGYILVSDGQTIHTLSWRIIFLFLIAYTLSLPIKDFKDIEGDKKDGIWTIPVIFGEKRGRLIVATGVFISFMLSVFFLNEMKLFFWAMLFGVSTFLFINNEKIKPRALPAWVLGFVAVYFFLLVWVVFI